MRYTLTIHFDQFSGGKYLNVPSVIEQIKTLKEAESYKCIIDNTVKTAFITDNISGKIIQTLKP